MNNSNSNNNPNKSIKTSDFKTLYTKISHNKYKEAMELFVTDVFGYNKNKYIDVRNKSAEMVNRRGNGLSFSIAELINTVIENWYIKFNSKVDKQIITLQICFFTDMKRNSSVTF